MLALLAALALGQAPAPGPAVAAARQTAAEPPSLAQSVLQGSSSAAQQEYDQTFLGLDEFVGATGWTTPYQGKYRRPLVGDEFYRIIGRDDLRDAYRSNETTRTAVIAGGGLLAVAVPVVALATRREETCPTFSDAWTRCVERNLESRTRSIAIAAAGVGTGALIAGLGYFLIRLHPVDAVEARRLADEHNQKLRARLGLALAPPPEAEREVKVSLAPLRGGGMVGISVSF